MRTDKQAYVLTSLGVFILMSISAVSLFFGIQVVLGIAHL